MLMGLGFEDIAFLKMYIVLVQWINSSHSLPCWHVALIADNKNLSIQNQVLFGILT